MEIYGSDYQSLVRNSIDFHCHGIKNLDFTNIEASDLLEIESILAERNHHIIITMYLPRKYFSKFLDFLDFFKEAKEKAKFKHILGIGLEGPALASHGGTPDIGVWFPTELEWEKIASCGQKGLVYSIFSPDLHLLKNYSGPSASYIAEILLAGGVIPALGHFLKIDPDESAKALQSVFNIVKQLGRGPIITDHLYNDMPLNFKHAWRSSSDKGKREKELKLLHLEEWNIDTVDKYLGPVPATIIKNSLAGLVKPCINFDGEHVDLAILKKTLDLVGAESIILMTDSIEGRSLGGNKLFEKENSTLLYQEKGVVAVGTQGLERQIKNMLSIGLSIEQIELITNYNPKKVLKDQVDFIRKSMNEKVNSF